MLQQSYRVSSTEGKCEFSPVRVQAFRTASAQDYFTKNLGLQTGVLLFPPKAEMEHSSGCEQQPSPNAPETRPHDENHEGASFAFCAGISRGGPGRAVPRCLGDFTAGSPGSPAGRLDGPKVSPGLSPGRVLG